MLSVVMNKNILYGNGVLRAKMQILLPVKMQSVTEVVFV